MWFRRLVELLRELKIENGKAKTKRIFDSGSLTAASDQNIKNLKQKIIWRMASFFSIMKFQKLRIRENYEEESEIYLKGKINKSFESMQDKRET